MKFLDEAKVWVKAGDGGDGVVAFRREKFLEFGGPDGGDGGRGGDVVLVCDDSLRDLERYRRRSHFSAGRGGHGQGSLRHGARGETIALPVPPGTQVLVERDDARHDLVLPGQRAVVAHGGSGGRGNKHFAGPTYQTPRFAERGLPGDETWVALRLKLLADVGLVGLPNAGKSSLLARLTRAHPKVADYPFTTLAPLLGTLEGADRQLVIADIPGLIEGASEGAGLGHEFLAHIERTRLLVHVLDVRPLDGSDPVANYSAIERELALHDPRLAARPRVLALSKADLLDPAEAAAARQEWSKRLGAEAPVILTSAVTGVGLSELTRELLVGVPPLSEPEADGSGEAQGPDVRELAEHRVYRPAAENTYDVQRIEEGRWRVSGAGVTRLVARYDLDNEEALAHLERRLQAIGVLNALEREGFQPGDEVEIAGVAFELHPGL
jgi:GTP-binding protein